MWFLLNCILKYCQKNTTIQYRFLFSDLDLTNSYCYNTFLDRNGDLDENIIFTLHFWISKRVQAIRTLHHSLSNEFKIELYRRTGKFDVLIYYRFETFSVSLQTFKDNLEFKTTYFNYSTFTTVPPIKVSDLANLKSNLLKASDLTKVFLDLGNQSFFPS